MSLATKNKSEFRIYVASLTDYNAGVYHGCWVDGLECKSAEEVEEEVQAMLKESPTAKRVPYPAEEWAIHDFEGFGRGVIGEWESFERVVALAAFLDETEEAGRAFLQWRGDEFKPDELLEAFQSAFSGEYEDLADYAEQMNESVLADVPDSIRWHIDFESMGKEYEQNGDIFTHDNGYKSLFIFDNRA